MTSSSAQMVLPSRAVATSCFHRIQSLSTPLSGTQSDKCCQSLKAWHFLNENSVLELVLSCSRVMAAFRLQLRNSVPSQDTSLMLTYYLVAPEMMDAPTDGSYEVEIHDVSMWEELQTVLQSDNFENGKGLKLVNVRMAKLDITKNFKGALQANGDQLCADPTE
ncbi:hypothetical protein K469DRAFT_683362 [Zopfia rhizophila CBS 207.26]|uniref:Uncharacterized protein n=1 Tax=Zopfia rhizophila CBS 207.26 TaxID=1314779 RepID=A0A6A6DC21_9PEZI|nr:hypothetical protein K469DRAFT_683362 [Zopfia rhizophila CBS 207.26]